MLNWRDHMLAFALGALLVGCARSEPQVPKHVITEICSGERMDSETRAQLRAASYSLADLGPEFLSQSAPLAKTVATRVEPVVIPALPPLAPSGAVIPALPAGAASEAAPVLIANGQDLVAINTRARPYSVEVPEMCRGNFRGASVVELCVSEAGSVTRVELLSPSVAWLDRQLPEVLGRWKFHPYVLNGRARPFCFTLKYSGNLPE